MTESVYAFQDAPDHDRYPVNLDTIHDVPEHGNANAIQEYGEAVGSDVTEMPDGDDTLYARIPSNFFTQRVPRTPRVGRTVTRTVYVFGNGNPQPLVNRSINRYRFLVWTDGANTQPVYIIGNDGDGVALAAGSLPVEFYGSEAFTVKSSANGIAYVVEESYYVNEHGE